MPHPWKCDHCGQPRERDANHWWLLDGRDAHHDHTGRAIPRRATLTAWTDARARRSYKHACGISCAMKLLERFASTGSFDPPSSRPVAKSESGKSVDPPCLSVPLPETEKTK